MATKLVIFGITGDLSTRKLLPALEHIIGSAEFEDLEIVGVSRRAVDVDQLLESAVGTRQNAGLYSIYTLDLADLSAYRGLAQYLNLSHDDQALIYLSVPPSAAAQIVDFLGQSGLNTPNIKLLFEKPFGFDVETAQEFIERTADYFDESQIYRIDHYMAKEVAAEIIRLRSDAENHHHSWSNRSIQAIDIVASEKIGVEGRSVFYEQTGALRDVLQGHLMQLLSLVLMPLPKRVDMHAIPGYRLRALEAIRPVDVRQTVRGQYDGYQHEVENIGTHVETFVSVRLESTDANWEGVSLRLVTGKNLADKQTFIRVTYTDGSHDIFEEGSVQSDDVRLPDAYERVLKEAILGNKALFTSSPEVLRSWEILSPLQQAWEFDAMPLVIYQPGTPWSDVRTLPLA